ncbi:MAG: hypothetical protein A4E64_00043 [Syntrophorhabdus sp. PtaU1.Bin058]|nr:MAG: hypothetical protein A4E64_00043 [Syntrophorhabdus sp. PtaU1.Bin058]
MFPMRQKGHRDGHPRVPSTRNMLENSVLSEMIADVPRSLPLWCFTGTRKSCGMKWSGVPSAPYLTSSACGLYAQSNSLKPSTIFVLFFARNSSWRSMNSGTVPSISPMMKRSKNLCSGSGLDITHTPPPTMRGSPPFLSRAKGLMPARRSISGMLM